MNFPYYNPQQGYHQVPPQTGFDQRRSSSSASQSQIQASPYPNFRPQVETFEFQPQYAFDPPSDWVQGPVASNDFLTDISEHIRSEHEGPWIPAAGTQTRTVDSGLQQYSPASASYVNKAHTVAGGAYSQQGFKRPPLKVRQSNISISDSGYGSQATNAISIPSVSQAEARTIVHLPPNRPQAVAKVSPRARSVKTEPSPSRSNATKRRRSRSVVPDCSTCGKELKNASEAHKHKLQHTKPFHCDIANCNKKDGFATINDLERHKKSVHAVTPKVGKTSLYYCQACEKPNGGSSLKPWPRLDNFKAHIKRKHADWEEDELIRRSEDRRPLYAESQNGYSHYSASIGTHDMENDQDIYSPTGHFMFRNPSQQQDIGPLFGQNSSQQLAHVGGVGGMADYSNSMQAPQMQFHMPQYSAADSMSTLCYAANQQLASPVDSMISPTNTRQSAPSLYLNDHAIPQYEDMDMDTPQAKRPRTLSMPSSSVSHTIMNTAVSPTISSTVSTGFTEGEHRCPEPGCNKVKRRECDLRKHMKRHTRPYGCTFAKCTKRFGSRNDWKRHENSQHFLAEMWRCDIKRAKSETKCGHLSHHQQQFAEHLSNAHGIKAGSDEMRTKCRDMHLGREGHHHFWCGFCNMLIEQEEGIQPGAWDVRFKHIGDHFDKENWNIEEWVDIEKNKKKKFLDREERKGKASLKVGADDDSDLGESGIPIPIYKKGKMVGDDVDAEGVSDDEWL